MKWTEWQAVANDETLWHDREEKGLLKAEYMGEYKLRLWFEEDLDVTIYELDLYELIVEDNPGGVFEVLKDKERFKLVEGDYSLVWLNPETGQYDEQAIDIAPESIRYYCEKYGKTVKVAEPLVPA